MLETDFGFHSVGETLAKSVAAEALHNAQGKEFS